MHSEGGKASRSILHSTIDIALVCFDVRNLRNWNIRMSNRKTKIESNGTGASFYFSIDEKQRFIQYSILSFISLSYHVYLVFTEENLLRKKGFIT